MSEKRNQNLKIVVIDDSDLGRRTIISILEKHGFNVVGQTGNPEEATKIAGSTGGNLFLIDIVMPKVSGLELANHLSEQISGIYIIMMSSLNIESVVIESISNGAIDFLAKPFSERELINSVEKIEAEYLKDQ